jgi:hypothetical protein
MLKIDTEGNMSRLRFIGLITVAARVLALPAIGMKKAELSISGTVAEIEYEQHQCGAGSGTHLELKTAGGSYQVHVGPTAFLYNQNFRIAKGDTLEITGSKVKMDGEDVVLPREITREGKKLTLRDRDGHPAWAGHN